MKSCYRVVCFHIKLWLPVNQTEPVLSIQQIFQGVLLSKLYQHVRLLTDITTDFKCSTSNKGNTIRNISELKSEK